MTFPVVAGAETADVDLGLLIKLDLFRSNPGLLGKAPYRVTAQIRPGVLEQLCQAIRGETITVTRENVDGFELLSAELGFHGLDASLAAFAAANPGIALEKLVRSMKRHVSEQAKVVEDLRAEVATLAGRLESARAAEGGDLRAWLDRSETVVGALAARLDRNEAAARDLGAGLEEGNRRRDAAHAKDVADLKARLDASVGGGSRGGAALEERVRSVETGLGGVRDRTDAVSAAAEALAAAVADLQERVWARCAERVPFAGKEMEGIVGQLTRKCDGNVDAKGVVAVTASTTMVARNAVDLADAATMYISENGPGQWLCLDFKERRVRPSHYALRSSTEGKGSFHPRSWALEVSADGEGWTEVDSRLENDDLNGPSVVKTFCVSRSEEGRFVRLRLTGKDHHDGNTLMCSGLEVFGCLRDGSAVAEVGLGSDPLDGIVARLGRECGGNVDERGVVALTAETEFAPRDAVDLADAATMYLSLNGPGQWLCLDFKERRVRPSHYALRSANQAKGWCHPRSWALEVSADGAGWTEVDSRSENDDLDGRSLVKAFPVRLTGEGRFVRLRLTGKDHNGSDVLALSALELFGAIL